MRVDIRPHRERAARSRFGSGQHVGERGWHAPTSSGPETGGCMSAVSFRSAMRMSDLFLPTEREPPADAEATSHKLMVRAGLIRQVGSGLWSWLPTGWRVHRKAEQVVREEIDAIGGQEMLMPVLLPADLW